MVKNLPANAGDAGSIPGSRRTPGEGNGNPLQYSYLGNPTKKPAWWATVHEFTKSWILLLLISNSFIKMNFYCNIVTLQCCVSFCCT